MKIVTNRGARTNPSEYYDDYGQGFDLFDQALIVEPSPVIELKSNYGVSRLRDRVNTSAGGTVTNADGEFRLSTAADGSSTSSLESAERGRYIPGLTAVPGIAIRIPSLPTGNQVIRWGYYDDQNGFGYKLTSSGLFTFIRRKGTEQTTDQSEWDDPLNGNGPSGITLDVSYMTIYRFPFRWYGSGPVQFEISITQSDIYSRVTKAHTAGNSKDPFIANPNLPIKAEIDNGGTATTIDVFVAGRQFFIYGRQLVNRRNSSTNRLSQTVGTSELVPLISFRQKADFNSVSVKLEGATVLSDQDLRVVMLVDTILDSGVSFGPDSDTPAEETAVEWDTSATVLEDFGVKQYETFAGGGSQPSRSGDNNLNLPQYDMPSDDTVVTLAAVSLGSSATVSSIFRIREEW